MGQMAVSLNDRAMPVADQLAADAEALGCSVAEVGGARVIDAGVKQTGSIQAGLLTARICLADLATVAVAAGTAPQTPWPTIVVNVNRPTAACMASQYAGWRISEGKYFAMGSGPMRAAYGKEPLFDQINLRETPAVAVGVLETGALPDESIVRYIAQACSVDADHLTLIATRTASLAGGTQVAARSVETAMHKLHELKFDLTRVVGGFGQTPLPPVAKDDMAAIGRTNDAVLYGAQCTLYLRGDDTSLHQVCPKLPSNTSKDYGQPFAEIFKRYDFDFYKIDPMLFSPAAVVLQNIDTGCTHTAGSINNDILAASFFG